MPSSCLRGPSSHHECEGIFAIEASVFKKEKNGGDGGIKQQYDFRPIEPIRFSGAVRDDAVVDIPLKNMGDIKRRKEALKNAPPIVFHEKPLIGSIDAIHRLSVVGAGSKKGYQSSSADQQKQ
ncbi:hypothetical protein Zm00014a_034474 [Zea mays]|uniref:Uncharacterized protein n=1 Tax=Zea mays TaxID=4577 RepID=A0A3L6ESB6_MAIZE|nr:hypothetical protein Zm00014a_034474 [Zea mays]